MRSLLTKLLCLHSLLPLIAGITVDTTSKESLQTASQITIQGMLSYYDGTEKGEIPGVFNQLQGYYWWMAGAAWNALMQYWWLTGDTTYNQLVIDAMMFQVGANNDYMPANQTDSEGNDDQAFWGLAAMAAAEMDFPNPPANKPQWLALAQAVFNEQVSRWDPSNCGGGLRWQIFPFNNGYDYKNSISNGCLFHLAARLARYTGNSTYMTYAERTFDWMNEIGLLDNSSWSVYDGTSIPNCTSFNHIEWTYNNGQLLSGAAYLYNFTNGDPTWKARLDSLISAAQTKFFSNGIVWEPACDQNYNCDTDQFCFKGFLAQYMGLATRMAPYTASELLPLLASTAEAAAAHCDSGTNNTMCTPFWTSDTAPVSYGVGPQMSALNVFNANLLQFVESAKVVTSSTGGNSTGNVNAGNPASDEVNLITPATTGDRVLAGVLTSLVSVGSIGFACWLAI